VKHLGAGPQQTISIVIPAYEEGPRIAGVLAPLATTRWITERIVIDDGSTDDTAEVAMSYAGVDVVRLPENRGKGAALQAGLDRAAGDVVVFLDADLLGLEPRHVALLVRPLVTHDELGMTVGRFVAGRLATDMSQALTPILNGQRALKRRFIDALPDLSDLRYGVETFLSRFARRAGEHTRSVKLSGLAQVMKEEKHERFEQAAEERVAMSLDAIDGWNRAGAGGA